MKLQKGTTPSWRRPYWIRFKLETSTVNFLDVLVEARMVQSKAEAKRIVEQGIIWKDVSIDECTLPKFAGTCIWDRIFKLECSDIKNLNVEIDDMFCIGRTIDEAICHRIEFI